MAGIFGFFDFEKPGKGVDPDAPSKNSFFMFWEILWRKLPRLILINAILFVVSIPMLTYIYMYFFSWAAESLDISAVEISTLMFQLLISMMSALPDWLRSVLLVIPIALYGPLMAGVTYAFRNFAREEYVWMSDIFSKFKQNFKQGLFFGVLDIIVLILAAINLTSTFSAGDLGATGTEFTLLNISGYVTFFILIVYLFARNYFYTLMVTFHLSIVQILKNSFIFAILGIWRNLLTVVLMIGILAACILIHPLAEVFTFILITFSLIGFSSVYICYPIVKKYMLDPMLAKKAEEENEKDTPPASPIDLKYIDSQYYSDRKNDDGADSSEE